MRTRGAYGCVRNTATGFPDWTSIVSSSSSSRSVRTIASNASQLRAARPVPPYTTRSSGRSATSGSRLFISIRSAASCVQPLQLSSAPRGARIVREEFVVVIRVRGSGRSVFSVRFSVVGGGGPRHVASSPYHERSGGELGAGGRYSRGYAAAQWSAESGG